MKQTVNNMKFAIGEVVYAFYRAKLLLATVLSGRTVTNMYGPCSHLYTVSLIYEGETLEVELDELSVFRHATSVNLAKKQKNIELNVDTVSDLLKEFTKPGGVNPQRRSVIRNIMAEIDNDLEQVQNHCKVQHIQIPEGIKLTIQEYEKNVVSFRLALRSDAAAKILTMKTYTQPTTLVVVNIHDNDTPAVVPTRQTDPLPNKLTA